MADAKKAPANKSKATAEAVGKHLSKAHEAGQKPVGCFPATGKFRGKPSDKQRTRAKRAKARR